MRYHKIAKQKRYANHRNILHLYKIDDIIIFKTGNVNQEIFDWIPARYLSW